MEFEASGRSLPISTDFNSSRNRFDLLDAMVVLCRRRRLIVLFTLGATVLAVAVSLLLPNEYTATTVLLPPGQNSSSASQLLGQLSGSSALASSAGAGLGIKNPGDQYVSLLHSRTLEDAVIQRFGLTARYHAKFPSDARALLEKHVSISYGVKDGLITIKVTDRDPKIAADIANGYLEEYRKYSSGLAVSEASQRRLYFQQQMQEAQEKLAVAENAFTKSEQTNGVVQIDAQTRSLLETAAVIRAQILSKEVQIRGMESYAEDVNPEVVSVKRQLAELRAQLSKVSNIDPDSGLTLPKGKVSLLGVDYMRKMRDVKYYETVTELIAKQYEVAKLDEARHGAFIQVVDSAIVPDKKTSPKRLSIVVMAASMSFFIICLWSIFRERWVRLKCSPKVEQALASLSSNIRG